MAKSTTKHRFIEDLDVNAFDEILDCITASLKNGKQGSLASSVLLALPEGKMYANSYSGIAEPGEFYERFSWKPPIRGLAGFCAATRQTYLISDLNSNPKLKQELHWIEIASDPVGGIMTIPIVYSAKNDGQAYCLAVVSISTNVPNYLSEIHVKQIKPFVRAIQDLIVKTTDFVGECYNTANNLITEKDILMRLEQEQAISPNVENLEQLRDSFLALCQSLSFDDRKNLLSSIGENLIEQRPAEFLAKVDDAVTEIREELHQNWRVQGKPTKHETILELLRLGAINRQGVPFELFVQLYEETAYPDKTATATIGKLNKQLAKYNLRIERSSEYFLISTDSKPINAEK
jgi:hypothetical protein